MYDFSFARARYGFVEAARKLFIKLDHAQCSTQARRAPSRASIP